MPQRDFQKEGVCAAWINPGHVNSRFMDSMLDTLRDGVWDGSRISMISGPRIAEARSQVVEAFLKHHPHKEWLWMIDTDMSFPGESLRGLMEVANRTTRQVVGGLCFAGGHSRLFPTIYETIELDEGIAMPSLVSDHQVLTDAIAAKAPIKVPATGGAFLLVHRNVLTRMSSPHPTGFGTYKDGRNNPYPWFVEGQHFGEGRAAPGEDIIFTWRAHVMGFGVFVHTGVEIDHWKERPLNRALWETPNGQLDILDYPQKETA